MRPNPALTLRQRRVLLGLFIVLLLVLGGMGWFVWTTTRALPTVSLLPTPSPMPTWTPTPTLTPIPTPTSTPFFETGEAGQVAREVADAREVLPRWETPLTFVDTYDLSVILYRYYQETPPFPLSARRVLEVLDLWPSIDVEPDPVTQAEMVAATYLPEQRQLYIRRDWEESFRRLRSQAAYGYARALPEQYGDLARLRADATTVDQRLAIDALARGDALVTFWRYANVKPGSPAAEAMQGLIEPAMLPVWQDTSPELDALTRLSLNLGVDFALARYEAEGLSALDAALRNPPRTTEQVLHPLTYEEYEASALLEPLTPELDAGWTLTQTETVGQALMQLAFDTWSRDAITLTAESWDGDLLQVWQGPGQAEVVLWQIAWDANRMAVDVEAQISALLPRRVPGYVRETDRPEGLPRGTWWEGSQGAAFLYRYLDRMWLIWGDDPLAVQVVGAALIGSGNEP